MANIDTTARIPDITLMGRDSSIQFDVGIQASRADNVTKSKLNSGLFNQSQEGAMFPRS